MAGETSAAMPHPGLVVIGIVVLASPVWIVVGMFLLSLYERNLSRPFVPARKKLSADDALGSRVLEYGANLPDASQASRYLVRMCADLRDEKFEFGDMVASVKPLIQWLGAVWWSPQRDIAALTGSGTIAKIGTSQTWLITRLRDGRFLVTTDFPESELSGLSVISRMLNVRLRTLLRRHRRRMARRAADVVAFDEPSAYEAVDAYFTRRLARLIARRRARYLDDETRTHWVYTWFGALLMCGEVWKLAILALLQFWRYFNPRWIWRRALNPIGTDLLAGAVAR
jgi:hypothetical protein